jgi:hypothetical protein
MMTPAIPHFICGDMAISFWAPALRFTMFNYARQPGVPRPNPG